MPGELVDRASALGMRALALTDTDGLYGMTVFVEECNRAGIRPIIGAAVTEPRAPAAPGEPARDPAPAAGWWKYAVLLCENEKGYETLCGLITARHCDADFELVPALRRADPDGLILISPWAELLDGLVQEWRGRIFAEIILTDFDADRKRAAKLADFARANRIPLAATAAAYSANGTRGEMTRHHVLRAMRELTTLSALRQGEVAQPEQKILSANEIWSRYFRYPDAVRNAAAIAERCAFAPNLGKWHFPKFPLPFGLSEWQYFHDLCLSGLKARIPDAGSRYLNQLEYEIRIIADGRFIPYFLILHDIVAWAHSRGMFTIGRGSAANSLVAYALGITDVDPIKHDLFFERFLNPERKSLPDIDIDFSWKDRDRVYEYIYNKYGGDRVANVCTYVTFQAKSGYREVAKVLGYSDAQITRITKMLSGLRGRQLEYIGDPEFDANPAVAQLRDEPHARIIDIAKGIAGFPTHLSVHCGGVVIAPGKLSRFLPVQPTAKSGIMLTQLDMWGVEDVGLVKVDILSLRALETVQQTIRDVNGRLEINPQDVDAIYGDERTKARMREARTIGCFDIESPGMRELYFLTKCQSYPEATINTSVIRPGAAGTGAKEQYVRCRLGLEKANYLLPELEPVLRSTYGKLVFQEQVMQVAHDIAGMSWAEADTFRRAMSGKERSLRGGELMAVALVDFRRRCAERGIPRDAVEQLAEELRSFAGYSFCKAHAAAFARVSGLAVYLKEHFPAEYMAAVLSNGSGIYYITSGPQAYVSEARRTGVAVLPPDVNKSEDRWVAEYASGAEGVNDIPAIRTGLRSIFGLSGATRERILAERAARPFRDAADFMSRVRPGDDEARHLVDCGALDFGECTGSPVPWVGASSRTPKKYNRNELHWLAQVSNENCRGAVYPPPPQSAGGDKPRPYDSGGRTQCASAAAVALFDDKPYSQIAVPELPAPSEKEIMLAEWRSLGFSPRAHPVEIWSEELEAAVEKLREKPKHAAFPHKGASKNNWDNSMHAAPETGGISGYSNSGRYKAHPYNSRNGTGIPVILQTQLADYVGRYVIVCGYVIEARRTVTKQDRRMRFLTLDRPEGVINCVMWPDAYDRAVAMGHPGEVAAVLGRVADNHGSLSVEVERVEVVKTEQHSE